MIKPLPFYSDVVEQLSIGVLIFNAADRLVYMNNTAQEVLEVSDRKALGERVDIILASDTFNIQCYFNKARSEGLRSIERDVQFLQPGENSFNISVSPFQSSNESQVLVEISNTNHYQQITREDALLSQNKMATNMLKGLAHEIKNPLAGLRGAAQLLSAELKGDLNDYTRVIIDEADRLRDLVDRMLGSTEVVKQKNVSIHAILERVRQLVQLEVADRILIKTDYDPSLPELTADKDQLIQAVLNIVRNATQAIQLKGEITLKTRIHRNFVVGDENYKLGVKVDVIDNGLGIPQDMQTKVFYPMVTGRDNGTGLGLSIAQTNVRRHRGFIELNSKPGRTVFSIILPFGHHYGR
ncbi:MAG: PAS domain-containing sensor histidine kinase [Piscirickettsiaceae bacterium]|nr:MAG: PAS domain-containing sensor histidine kinase [Piscirickettsiaceae bacterium]